MIKMSTSICLKSAFTLAAFFMLLGRFNAQESASKVNRIAVDTSDKSMNMDAVYNRPFLKVDKMPVALGGYLEMNSLYESEDGISEGLSFQARRLTIFMSASLAKRIKFLSEMEFEDGTKEIGIEFAAVDVTFHPSLNFRGGIIMNPIGAFNQNHDGPRWEFVNRPDVSVNMLPATWSNAGFGLFGKTYKGNWILGYEIYLSNGFDGSIIDNEESKTFLPAAKENEERFEESINGEPLITAKLTLKNREIGELGVSYMGGIYNRFEADGIDLDQKRRINVFALDMNTGIKRTGTRFVGEFVYNFIDVPETFTQQFGDEQRGFFLDVIQPIWKRRLLEWDKATFNLAARLDYVDWNVGEFVGTGEDIGEELWAISPALSFRPTSQTVFRLNYRYQWQKDILSNPNVKSASWLFGFSTYF